MRHSDKHIRKKRKGSRTSTTSKPVREPKIRRIIKEIGGP